LTRQRSTPRPSQVLAWSRDSDLFGDGHVLVAVRESGRWITSTVALVDESALPVVAIDDTGGAELVWFGATELGNVRSVDAYAARYVPGAGWRNPEPLGPVTFATPLPGLLDLVAARPAVAVGPTGPAIAAWGGAGVIAARLAH
jgi:hypothetical protein